MGASAGGHLASTLATHYSAAIRVPTFRFLLYPVVTMTQSTHGGSRKELLGGNPTAEQKVLFSNELQVTSDTPQAFIVLSSDDGAVPPSNGVNYYLALQKNNVPASLHVYLPADMAGDSGTTSSISNNGHRNSKSGCVRVSYFRRRQHRC